MLISARYGQGGPAVAVGQVIIPNPAAAVQLPSHPLLNGVTLKCMMADTNAVYVGDSGVSTVHDGTGTSYQLLQGESIFIPVNNANLIWILGSTGDWVSYIGA